MTARRDDASAELRTALENLQGLSHGFNVFEAVGLQHQEIRHSHFLAYLLAPSNPHGLGAAFTRGFLTELFGEVPGLVTDPTNIEVRREWQFIDLMVIDHARQSVFVVENKLWAGEHGDQLARYVDVVEGAFPEYEPSFAFLSPTGVAPSDARYVAAGYDAVARVLETTLESDVTSSRLRLVLEDYLELLRRHVLKTTDVARLCADVWRTHDTELSALMSTPHSDDDGVAGPPGVTTKYAAAWSLLVSHRPGLRDLTSDLAVEFREIVHAEMDVVEAFTSKVYVAFRPKAWMEDFERLRVKWPELSQFPLYFELNVQPRALRFDAWIAERVPGPLRQAVYDWARQRPKLFAGMHPRLNKGSTSLLTTFLLKPEDYDEASWRAVEAKARDGFLELLQGSIRPISDAVREVSWPIPSDTG